MGIPFGSSFDLAAAVPLDGRIRKDDITARNGIDVNFRFQGLSCFVQSTQKNYQLRGGTTDPYWVNMDDLADDIFAFDTANRKYTPYTDANKGAGRFYNWSATYPTNSYALAFDGYLYATGLRSGGSSNFVTINADGSIQSNVGGVSRFTANPGTADTGSNIAYTLDTTNALTSGRKILSLRTSGNEKAYFSFDGSLTVLAQIQGNVTTGNGVVGIATSGTGGNFSSGIGTGLAASSTTGIALWAFKSGTLTAIDSSSFFVIQRVYNTSTYNSSGNIITVEDNPTGAGVISGSLLYASVNTVNRVDMNPRVTDGSTNIAYMFDTHNALTSGRKLFSLKNQGTEKFYVDYNGNAFCTGVQVSVSTHGHSGTYEPVLGNPGTNGYVLSSTTAGVRSWIAATGGTSAHGSLSQLDYASSGHTGFAEGQSASYAFTLGSVGWIRIATLGGYNGHGTISITNSYYNNRPAPVVFTFGSTYRDTGYIHQIGGTNEIFSRARIVYPTSTDDPYYIEVYCNTTSTQNTYYLKLTNFFNVTLGSSYVAGSVPGGYSTYVQEFSKGMAAQYILFSGSGGQYPWELRTSSGANEMYLYEMTGVNLKMTLNSSGQLRLNNSSNTYITMTNTRFQVYYDMSLYNTLNFTTTDLSTSGPGVINATTLNLSATTTVTGTLNVTSTLSQGGTAVSLSGHTHSYAGAGSAGGTAYETLKIRHEDLNRAWNDAPNSLNRQLTIGFKTPTGLPNSGGNYAGAFSFSPWDGTSGSTGDCSYNLAFYHSGAANVTDQPRIAIRSGIDTTWGAWYELLTSQYNSSLSTDTRNTRGVTRLYRNDSDTDYSVQVHYDGRWYLRGYATDTYHNEVKVDYAVYAATAGSTSSASSATNASFTTASFSRTDGTAYQICWIADNGGRSQMYGCAAVTIQSDIGRIYATSFYGGQFIASDWFRTTGQTGMYSSSYGSHFYSVSANSWGITAAGSGTVELKFMATHQGTVYGFVYGDSSANFGLLSNTGNWGVRVSPGGGAAPGGTLYGAWSATGNISAANLSGTNTGDQTSINYATTAGSAPASDVYGWAKAASKPSYSISEITNGLSDSAGAAQMVTGTTDITCPAAEANMNSMTIGLTATTNRLFLIFTASFYTSAANQSFYLIINVDGSNYATNREYLTSGWQILTIHCMINVNIGQTYYCYVRWSGSTSVSQRGSTDSYRRFSAMCVS